MAIMSIRVSEPDKQQAAAVAEHYGFDLSSVTRAFWKQMVREQRIPLNLGAYEPNAETLESLRQGEEAIKSGTARFADADEMLASLKD
ncbi:damage-inducible protein J [Bifidobacterium sp. DSM 109963]|uniref:Damage-inducible protein J n=2 Tax=Bifidobacterium panos TaxID=2675321 RepID=A0ABX1T116_9BIFI|nr:damage-inducible protein J [Bifidobacterium sp. DSM 109963]